MGLPAVVVMKNPNERLAFSVSVRRGEQRWAGHASAIAILTKAATPTLVDCRKVSRRGKWQFFRARFYRSTKIRFSLILPLRESCWETFSTNAEAKKRKKQIEYEQDSGTFFIPTAKTLNDLLDEYMSIYGVNTWAMSTYESRRGLARNYITPIIGDMLLSDITPRMMDK